MSPDEAADFLEGYRRRHRQMWEAARDGWMMQVSDTKGRDKTEIFPFPWDPKPKVKRVTKKQREVLREKAAKMAEKIREANGKK